MFLALHLPTDLVAVVEAALGDLPGVVDAAWTRPSGWHVTLAWLDRLDDDLADRVGAVTADVVTQFGAAFGQPRVAVLDGVVRLGRAVGLRVDLSDAVLGLHERLVRDLQAAAGADLSPRARQALERPLCPHLTLARVRRGDDPARVRAAVAERWPGPVTWPVSQVALVESHPGDGPAHYAVRAAWPLPA